MKIIPTALISAVLTSTFAVAIGSAAAATPQPESLGEDVVAEIYNPGSDQPLRIHRFDPPGHKPQVDRRPAVVFFFGGGWVGGDIRQFEQHARYLATRGMVAFLADYRVKSRHGTGPDACVADGKAAIRWIRTNATRLGVDPDRIAAGGGSAGGQVAAAAGMCDGLDPTAERAASISSKPNALLLFNPVYDNGPNGWGHAAAKAWFPAISPAHNITTDDPPTTVFLGTADKLISVETAKRFDAALKDAGVTSELWLYPDEPHGFFNERSSQTCFIDTVLRMDAFLASLGWLEGPADRTLLHKQLNQPLTQPNIVVVMCDDLGYGDVHCLNPEHGKIATPHADQLAHEGLIFTDAHSGSSVCTPTRYGLLTGRYSWRTRLQRGVTQGYAPCLIAAGRPTVASFLQTQGYKTSIVGKWHLDFQYLDPVTQEPLHRKQQRLPPVGARIPDGPISRGFDYFHGFHHAGDMQAVIQNDRVIEHDDEINMLPRLTTQAVNQIETLSQTQQPFFLYVPLSSPHTPILPSPEWQGKSGLGDYGDFVMQTDHALGEIMSAIERSGCEDKTLLIFTSDNGCSKAANIPELARQGHHVSGPYRGSKADLWEGGHRVPFIVRWPGRIKQGSTCQQSLCLTDLFATVAEILLTNLPDGSAEDSVSFLPALTGQLISPVRSGIVHHSISGHFGYRHDNWKLLLAHGSGGWTSPKEQKAREQGLPAAQLYRLDRDPAETENLAAKNPETFGKLLGLLKADVDRGRSTPGNNATNDTTDIRLWKSGEPQNLGSAVGSAP